MSFLENLDSLHKEEERIRNMSLETLKKNDELLLHSDMADVTLSLINYFTNSYKSTDAD